MTTTKANRYWASRAKFHRVSGEVSAYSCVIVDAKRELHKLNDRKDRLLQVMNKYEKEVGISPTK